MRTGPPRRERAGLPAWWVPISISGKLNQGVRERLPVHVSAGCPECALNEGAFRSVPGRHGAPSCATHSRPEDWPVWRSVAARQLSSLGLLSVSREEEEDVNLERGLTFCASGVVGLGAGPPRRGRGVQAGPYCGLWEVSWHLRCGV